MTAAGLEFNPNDPCSYMASFIPIVKCCLHIALCDGPTGRHDKRPNCIALNCVFFTSDPLLSGDSAELLWL